MLKKLSKGLWNYHTFGLAIFIPLLLLPLPLVIGTLVSVFHCTCHQIRATSNNKRCSVSEFILFLLKV